MGMGVFTAVYREIKKHPKLRKLSKALGTSKAEAIGLLYVMWDFCQDDADENGTLAEVEREDIEDELRQFSDVSPEKAVDAMLEVGWLDKSHGKLTLHNWDIWQAHWVKAKERRQKDADRKRRWREEQRAARDAAIGEQQTIPLNPPEEPKKEEKVSEPPKPAAKAKTAYAKGFETFWAAYPRHVDKGVAYKKYLARLNSGFSEAQLLLAAENYAAQCAKDHTEMKYIKHPSTFLSDTTPFTDYLPKALDPNPVEGEEPKNPFAEYQEVI